MDSMTNLETNALRIIGLLYPDIDINGIEKYKEFFSTYNGLMPIVFECNGGEHYVITINWNVRLEDKTNGKTLYYDFRVGLTTEPEFIEAIQECVIKYLELRNG